VIRGGARDRFITVPLFSDHSPEEVMQLFSSVVNELLCEAFLTADISASFASLRIVP